MVSLMERCEILLRIVKNSEYKHKGDLCHNIFNFMVHITIKILLCKRNIFSFLLNQKIIIWIKMNQEQYISDISEKV